MKFSLLLMNITVHRKIPTVFSYSANFLTMRENVTSHIVYC